jgi:hypothetical protein
MCVTLLFKKTPKYSNQVLSSVLRVGKVWHASGRKYTSDKLHLSMSCNAVSYKFNVTTKNIEYPKKEEETCK